MLAGVLLLCSACGRAATPSEPAASTGTLPAAAGTRRTTVPTGNPSAAEPSDGTRAPPPSDTASPALAPRHCGDGSQAGKGWGIASYGAREIGDQCPNGRMPLLSPDGAVVAHAFYRFVPTRAEPCDDGGAGRDVVEFLEWPRGRRLGERDVTGYEILPCECGYGSYELTAGHHAEIHTVMTPAGHPAGVLTSLTDPRALPVAEAWCARGAAMALERVCLCRSLVHRRVLVQCIYLTGGDCGGTRDPELLMLSYEPVGVPASGASAGPTPSTTAPNAPAADGARALPRCYPYAERAGRCLSRCTDVNDCADHARPGEPLSKGWPLACHAQRCVPLPPREVLR